MSIIGENFAPDLIKQIETRESKLGKTNLDPADIVYNNSRTAWLRMASGVDLKDASKAGLGNINPSGLTGNKLASNFILYGGVSSVDEGNPASTVFSKGSNINSQIKSQYGVGFSTDWGPVPPPGIESLEIQSINRGGLRKAQLQLIAHNPDQFKLIETLYLRLGFTMLVEWGHTHYYDNGGNLKEMDYTTDPLTSFLGTAGGGFERYRTLQDKIDSTRQKTKYNYDGFVGFVQNFNWNFSENGTYSINLTLISSGALIESLTINRGPSSEHTSKIGKSISGDVFSSYVQHWTKALKGSNNEIGETDDWRELYKNGFLTLRTKENNKNNILIANDVNNSASESLAFDVVKAQEVIRLGMNQPSIEGGFEAADQYYVSLGFFLRFLETSGLYYDGNDEAIFGIQHEYDTSFMLTHPFQNSVDPTICMLDSETIMLDSYLTDGSLIANSAGRPRESTRENIKVPKTTGGYFSLFRQGEEGNKKFQGDIMGIMVNMNYIINTINSTKSEDGTTTCHAVLSAILNGIERVTGNINSFVIGYNEKTRKIIIYDENTIPGITGKGKTGKINLYGFEAGKTQGNFVKNFSFNTKVFPDITNLVAIGAQSEIPLPDKASSYQVLNRNLTDRLMSGMNVSPYKAKTSDNKDSSSNYLTLIANLSHHFRVLYNERYFRGPTSVDYATSLREALLYDLQYRVKFKEIPSPFFIPVGLSVTLDGLSGMTKYQKFDVGPDYILPPEYPNNLDFIIQEINHSIKNNEWTTTLDTLSWPKPQTPSIRKTISDEVFTGIQSIVLGEAPGLTEFPLVDGATTDPIFVTNSNTLSENFGITRGATLSQDKLLKCFHPNVRNRFDTFFTRMKNNPKLKGYKITINSALRTFSQQNDLYNQNQTTVAGGDSKHNYGVAIDLGLTHPTLGVVCSKTTDIDIWRQSGVPINMQFTGVNFWKGDHESDGYVDRVHFHVKLNVAAAKERAIEYYYDINNLDVDQIFNLDISDLIT